jgi:hypothetical protein
MARPNAESSGRSFHNNKQADRQHNGPEFKG